MLTVRNTASALAVALLIAGCDRSNPVQPVPRATAAASHDATGGKPEIDPTYANGQTVYMIGPRMIVNARETQPKLYEHAEELYLLVYPQQGTPTPSSSPITLPSGCTVSLSGATMNRHERLAAWSSGRRSISPGMGINGTAGEMKGPWKIILLVYNPAYVSSPSFTPIKSEADIDAAEAAGNVFLPINQGGDNPYEIDTGNVLICPVVSSHA